MLPLFLILLQRNQIIWFCVVNTFQTLLHLPYHASPWLYFPSKQVKSLYLFVSMDHLYTPLLHWTRDCFLPKRWFAVIPSTSSLWAHSKFVRKKSTPVGEIVPVNCLFPVWDVLNWPHKISPSLHNRKRLFLLWALASNTRKLLSWLGFCVLFVYLAATISREETLGNYHYKVE